MTNRAAAGSVLAVAICLAGVPVSTQQPRNAEAARKAAEAISSKLPSIAIIGADGLSANIDGRLSYEDGKTILRYTIANTGDEPLLGADLTLLVYERSGKRRETQTISMDLGGVLEAGARKALKSDLAVRVDFSDRVRLGISRAVTATGPWTSDRFEERTDKGQLPAVDTIDPKPMPVRLESARVVEKHDRLRAEFDFISLADNPVVRATVTLLVYDENGKRTGLQDMPLPAEQLPLPPREKATVDVEIDGQLTIKPGNHVRLGVKSVLAGDAEQENLRLVTDSDRTIAEEHESHVSVVSPDVAPAATPSAINK